MLHTTLSLQLQVRHSSKQGMKLEDESVVLYGESSTIQNDFTMETKFKSSVIRSQTLSTDANVADGSVTCERVRTFLDCLTTYLQLVTYEVIAWSISMHLHNQWK